MKQVKKIFFAILLVGFSVTVSAEKVAGKFLPIIEACESENTTYEKKICKNNIEINAIYIVEGTVHDIISEKKIVLKLSTDHYANIFAEFNIEKILALSKNKKKFSFKGKLTDLGTGIMVKHDFYLIND